MGSTQIQPGNAISRHHLTFHFLTVMRKIKTHHSDCLQRYCTVTAYKLFVNMKNLVNNSRQILSIATFCILFGLPLMSFQTSPPITTCELETNFSPSAYFTVQNNGCEGPCEIIFNNQSTGGDTYHWDFGDGNTSSEENPRHTYQDAGTYTVKLTVFGGSETSEFIGTVDILQM